MKYIGIICAVTALLFASCTKLDRFPLSQVSSETFWQSQADFEKALAANYATLQNSMWSYGMPIWDCMTDNGYAQHDAGVRNIARGDISPSTGGYILDVYRLSYQAITRINIFLQELGRYQGNDMSEGTKKAYEGEVRFLRAFFYFQLYSAYGEVPLVLEPLTIETQEQAKQPADKILEQILADLDFAIANLNQVPYSQNGGHLVSSSAKALKARVLSFAAYDNAGTPDIAMLTTVRDLCQDIRADYSLSPAFTDLFRNAGQTGNSEIIFSVNFLAPDNVSQWDLWYGDWLSASPLQNFLDAFECTDGLPFGISPLTDLNAPMENRDPRLNMTVFVDHVDWGGGNLHFPSNQKPTGYGVKKFLEPGNTPYDYSTRSDQNAVLLRLGEVLLMYAEAQNEIAGPDESVYDAMEELRLRVDMPAYPAGLSKDEMRERIRHERRVELAFEGLRYYDLKRWRIAGEVLNNVTDGIINYNFEDKFYEWPLPQPEIERNHGTLVQNPAYN